MGENRYDEERIEEFIADSRQRQYPDDGQHADMLRARPGTSYGKEQNNKRPSDRTMTPEDRANQHIRDAETSKARIHDVPGKRFDFNQVDLETEREKTGLMELDLSKDYVHSTMVDESYQLVASHLDSNIQEKIVKGDYVDFGHLVPKDRVLTADDSRYEMIVCDGKTFWIPASNNEATEISNYNRWEQAFRVYSDVYMRAHPHRSSELIQYSHLIHTASQSFTWKNVYMYDKDFRLHMSQHPQRCWSIILQQAWAVQLKDKVRQAQGGHSSVGGESKIPDICKRYNQGKCSFGNE